MEERLIDHIIETALEEDLAWGDITSELLIDHELVSEQTIILKEEGVVAGLEVAERVFRAVDPEVRWEPLRKDGDFCPAMTPIAKIYGHSVSILKGERVALNFLQRLSGISTRTRLYVQRVKQTSSKARITDTRKTTPGLRYLERYAVRMGGGFNHRNNLSDSILVKDNHLSILRNQGITIQEAVEMIREKVSHTIRVEIEVDDLEQLGQVPLSKVDTIMLDNMCCEDMKKAVEMIDGRALVEASGGVSLESVADIAATGVDVVSVGALTHSAPSLDIGLEFTQQLQPVI